MKISHKCLHTCMVKLDNGQLQRRFMFRVVNKSRGPGKNPWLLREWLPATLLENRRKLEPKEIPSRLIARLLVVFTRQLEILVTTLYVSRMSLS